MMMIIITTMAVKHHTTAEEGENKQTGQQLTLPLAAGWIHDHRHHHHHLLTYDEITAVLMAPQENHAHTGRQDGQAPSIVSPCAHRFRSLSPLADVEKILPISDAASRVSLPAGSTLRMLLPSPVESWVMMRGIRAPRLAAIDRGLDISHMDLRLVLFLI